MYDMSTYPPDTLHMPLFCRHTRVVFYTVLHMPVYYMKKNVVSARMLVSLLGVGTVLRLERDAWSMVE